MPVETKNGNSHSLNAVLARKEKVDSLKEGQEYQKNKYSFFQI
ncbi:unnamed protein product [marine sediment metagenome]|uniref:Uncharacterized protein n=1 Tax=marine sediment metagenome TaxID=412755 RepID=X0S195_9ZZZZ